MPTKTSKAGKASKASKGTAAAAATTIKRKSLSVGVRPRSNFDLITRAVQKALGEAGCLSCLSGLERLIIDARINVP